MLTNLFHYTNVNAFKKILEGNSLKFSHISQVRDSTEMNILEQALKCSYNKHIEKIVTLRFENYESLKNALFKQRQYSYIFCCCTDNNNDYLWREYADNSKGVCIEFNGNFFPSSSGRLQCDKLTFTRNRMIYGLENFAANFDCIIKNAQPGNNSFILWLSILSDAYKNICFECEREVRIVYQNSNFKLNASETGDFHNGQVYKFYSQSELFYSLHSSNNEYLIAPAIINIYVKDRSTELKVKEFCDTHSFKFPIEMIDCG